MIANREFMETADIQPAFLPVDMQTGANSGLWCNLRDYHRCLVVLFKAIGTAGDDPVVTLQQATSAAGAGAKALNFTRIRSKLGATFTQAGAPGTMTINTQAAANTYTDTNSAEEGGVFAIEVKAEDLDATNGFTFIQLSIPDTGTNAQLGGGLYIPYDSRHPQAVQNTCLA